MEPRAIAPCVPLGPGGSGGTWSPCLLRVSALPRWDTDKNKLSCLQEQARRREAQVTTALQVTVPGPTSHVTLPNLMAATKYRVLVSAVYGAGESTAVSATGRTGE